MVSRDSRVVEFMFHVGTFNPFSGTGSCTSQVLSRPKTARHDPKPRE